jgi:hypothetical protein
VLMVVTSHGKVSANIIDTEIRSQDHSNVIDMEVPFSGNFSVGTSSIILQLLQI